jgi:hypothetical protein
MTVQRLTAATAMIETAMCICVPGHRHGDTLPVTCPFSLVVSGFPGPSRGAGYDVREGGTWTWCGRLGRVNKFARFLAICPIPASLAFLAFTTGWLCFCRLRLHVDLSFSCAQFCYQLLLRSQSVHPLCTESTVFWVSSTDQFMPRKNQNIIPLISRSGTVR